MSKKMSLGPAREVTVVGTPNSVYLQDAGMLSGANFFQLPVTRFIPPMRPEGIKVEGQPHSDNVPDRRWLDGPKLLMKGLTLKFTLSYAVSVEMIAAAYGVKSWQGPSVQMDASMPKSFVVGKEVSFNGMDKETVFMELCDTGLATDQGKDGVVANADGPFRVRKNGMSPVLQIDSPDGMPFGARTARGSNAPVGKVFWTTHMNGTKKEDKVLRDEFHVATNVRGETIYNHFDSRKVQAYWELEKPLEFVEESGGRFVFEDDLMITVGVRPLMKRPGDEGVICGIVSDVTATVYYRTVYS
jgi:hypothetical protein